MQFVSSPRGGRSAPRPARRPWTRAATAGAAAHVFYELACGVGMPFASRIGPYKAAFAWGAGSTLAFRAAGRRPRSGDGSFAALNGMFLSAVIGHFVGWPRTRVGVLPWLTECEGLRGRPMLPYNVLLYVSGAAAAAGIAESSRGRRPALALSLALVPWAVHEQRRELARMRVLAQNRPAWWNRRLGTEFPQVVRPEAPPGARESSAALRAR